MFLRRLRVGEFAEFGGRSGRVLAVGLLEVRLEDDEGCEVRVPHLLSLVHPTRLLGEKPRLNVSLNIALSAWKPHLDELLLAATAGLGDGGRVEVVRIESESLTLRVSLTPTRGDARDALQRRVLELLAREKTAVLPKRPTAP